MNKETENQINKELEIKISELIILLNYLISVEDFPVYKKLKKNFENLYYNILNKQNISNEDFIVIQSCLRIYDDAPPKNYELGRKILDKMMEIYELRDRNINKGRT